jgi:glycosyltransferase involved in cell wall biosynthesis
MSMAILEAVAHGLPIITTSHSGFPDVEKVGIQIPSKNSDAIANAIITLLSDPNLLQKKSDNAQQVIKNYHWNTIAKAFTEVYQKIQP